ncbi:MAG: 30S ribosomal protein S1 [candidate division Zixibacteria bacterium]|nr:30S ribosomal protein S1 [candidate division Zixibacteria bacterium]
MDEMLGIVEVLLDFLGDYGLYGVFLIVLVLIVHNPDRVIQLKAVFLSPVYRLFKIGGKQYIAANICYTVTQFLRKQLVGVCKLSSMGKIKLRWVTSPKDPIFKQSGTLILRMKDSEDQSLNLLNATRQALPIILCPTIRSNLEPFFQTAIDLTVLRKLANGIGDHAKPVFQRHFLSPETAADARVADLFAKLVEVDTRGIFVTIFLNELDHAGECLYGAGDAKDKTAEVEALLEYLLLVARRKVGQHINLEYSSDTFRLGIVIIAIDAKAREEGVVPYVNGVDIKIRKGCDSIYLVAYSRQLSFLEKVLTVVEGDARVTIANNMRVEYLSEIHGNTPATLGVAVLRRNAIVQDDDFVDKVKTSGIKVGDIMSGTVIDVAEKKATVDVSGLLAVISWQECSWGVTSFCNEFLEAGKAYDFSVITIDGSKQRIELTRRLSENDPWARIPVPEVGESVMATIQSRGNSYLVGSTNLGLQVVIALDEIAWINPGESEISSLIGTEVEVKLVECDQENRVLRCSIRQMSTDPWPTIEQRWPPGTKLRGRVVEVTQDNVRVELDSGITGLVSAEEMAEAGFEFADFQETFVVGQGLDVVVTNLYPRRRRIRLGLQRNL